MKTAIFIPPLPRMSGGVFVLIQIANQLARMGHEVCLVQREEMGLEWVAPQVKMCPWEGLRLTPEYLWLVPEGWPNALAPGLHSGARCLVYVQNWAFMLGSLPKDVHWEHLPVEFLAVSDPVRWFVTEHTGRQAPVLRPAIDTARFYPAHILAEDQLATPAIAADNDTLRVAWMPRKNKALAQQIRHHAEARLARLHQLRLEWVEIHGRSADEVADLLRSSHIFLASGFPEGCPLPPLEALASGCVLTGFSGLGGWDYMRPLHPEAPYSPRPWWPVRAVPWGGNGFYAADADVPAAALALEEAALLLRKGGPQLAALRRHMAATVAAYSAEAQAQALTAIWQNLMPQA